tara:strand:+ start:2941 stop:3138 length:198 start_codon:yes stop_codon:yes gene_type:complete
MALFFETLNCGLVQEIPRFCPSDPFAILEIGKEGEPLRLCWGLIDGRFHDCCFFIVIFTHLGAHY